MTLWTTRAGGWRGRVAGLLAAAAALSAAGGAAADWPAPRHDVQRTARAAGTSNLTAPVPYWRRALGGSIDPFGALVVDLDGSGKGAILTTASERLVAKRADDTVVWQTDALGIKALIDAADLDGDGKLDILARTLDRVLVFRALDGALEWTEPAGEIGVISGVRLADFDDDGKLDVLVQDCGCCATQGQVGLAIWSFGAGLGAPKRLFSRPFDSSTECGASPSTTVVDVGGVGPARLVLGAPTAFSLWDPRSPANQPLATSPPLGTAVQTTTCLPADLDGVPGQELVCFDTAHRVFALGTAGGTLTLLWSEQVGAVDGATAIEPGAVADLDGDGLLEVIVSGSAADGTPTTYVYDAAKGGTGDGGPSPLASLPGEQLAGALPAQHLVLTESGQAVSLWSFQRAGASGAFAALPRLADRRALHDVDRALARVSGASQRLLAVDLDGDKLLDVVTGRVSPAPQLFAYSGRADHAPLGSYLLPDSTDVLAAWIVPPVTGASPQLMLARTDGLLTVHDASLAPANLPGVRFGGYYASGGWRQLSQVPVVAALGGGPASLVVPDSRGALLRFDPAGSTFAAPPRPAWASLATAWASIAPAIDKGRPGIVAVRDVLPPTNPPTQETVLLRADGSVAWHAPLEGAALTDPVTGDLDGDGVDDVMVQWGAPGQTVQQTRAFSGATGARLWDAAPIDSGDRQPAGAAVLDFDFDGLSDLLFQLAGTRVLSGKTGKEIARAGPTTDYFMPIVADVNGDGSPEITLTASFDTGRVLTHDLGSEICTAPAGELMYPYGALVVCPGGATRLVEGSWQHPSRLWAVDLVGPGVCPARSVVLAGGKVYPDEAAATAAGARLGQLTAASVHQDLTGLGRPSVALGSEDGFLYALDPCALTLDFAVPFGPPVGVPVFGDTDGDGNDELLVSVADGYLYDLRQPPIAAPAWVKDIDPKGDPNTDVDSLVTTDTLAGKWATVPGATSYEVAISDGGDTGLVTSPGWQDVGLADHVTLRGLPLQDGKRYFFAVRALLGPSRSPDVLSNGVTVHFPQVEPTDDGGPTTGPGGGGHGGAGGVSYTSGAPAGGAGEGAGLSGRACVCEAPGPGAPAAPLGWAALVFAAAVGAARRSSRRRGR